MKFQFFRTPARERPKRPWYREFIDKGVLLAQAEDPPDKSASGVATTLRAPDVAALADQLEEEGFAIPEPRGVLIPWAQIYGLMENPAYSSSIPLLELPPTSEIGPVLKSHHSLADTDFAIVPAGWHDGSGKTVKVNRLRGAVVSGADGDGLLRREVWETLQQISAFQRRPASDRTDTYHRRAWGIIRRCALQANARLDDFLYRSVVLTPEKLEIGLRRVDIGGTKVVEVSPSFSGAPCNWLENFDRQQTVPDRYDIPTPEGIVQVLVTPEVKTVLEQIRRLDARRVAGSRAEAFVTNPFAALGENAAKVIDPQQFEQARAEAGLIFDHFTAHIEPDAIGYPEKVGVLIESADAEGLSESALRLFKDDEELETFIHGVQQNLDKGFQFFAWAGYDLELLGDTQGELDKLRQALAERSKPRVLVSYVHVFDLSHYSSRIENIGVEKPYYSPFIAKKNDDDGWFPDNVIPIISFLPEGGSEPVAVPVTRDAREQIEAKLNEAKKDGRAEFNLKGFPRPIPVKEAEEILRTFDESLSDVESGKFDPDKHRKQDEKKGDRKSLIIKANIQSIDYEEARRDVLSAYSETPALPSALRPDVRLKEHQQKGVARLQHLFSKSPEHCRGVVLADDMGLGKTLQLLALIAWASEADPELDPVLIVAPVSLLENWEEETRKFFQDGALPVLTVYGDALQNLRVPRANIDEQLQKDGLVKFLKPGWRGDARLVLTTYETLRDLEFSFAEERWSIMVCDEAQKIKNPNAMVTRAAKKQKVRFKVACTGTPVENTLADLWCLFDFVQPGLLGALNEFGRRYRKPIEAQTDEENARVEELRSKIEPQVIRRTKAEVAKDLPSKIEREYRIPLSAHQRSLYAHSIELFRKRNEPNARVPFKNHLGLLHYLRLLCTDPRRHGMEVFKPEPLSEYCEKAPKLKWLLDTLSEIKKADEKAIIFCEFRAIQRLLQYYVEKVLDVSPDIINGDTTASVSAAESRQKRIKAFQNKPGFGVIILSPVAVGFGVNIQAANHVIHYTRTWNPAKEDQATDRAYRIGQEKDVHVYYPVVYANDFTTFEVKLHQLLNKKRSLAQDMLNGSGDIKPGEFAIDDVIPQATGVVFKEYVTLDDALQMRPDYFECLVAAIWNRRGFREVIRTPGAGDDGVDVVALNRPNGELIQCKSSSVDQTSLSWEAVKEVVAGAAAYQRKYLDVQFRLACVTNQHFNPTAHRHAENNGVTLYEQENLEQLLADYPVRLLDVEQYLYTDWEQAA